MEINPYQVQISELFHAHFKEIHDFVRNYSYQSSQKLQKDVVSIIAEVCECPTSYNIAKVAKTGKIFRYVKILKHYKIYFYIENEVIVILDILHEKRSPTAIDHLEDI